MAGPNGRGLYFLNCTRGSEQKSTLAVYNNFIENGGNDNTAPSLLTDVTSDGFATWETGTAHTDERILISYTINTDAGSVNDGSQVGTAHIERNFGEHWEVFRDNGRVLLTTNDGFVCSTVYFSREVSGST
jgi:hypothetical protein